MAKAFRRNQGIAMLDDGVSRLIADIYVSAHDPALWDRVLDELLARTRSRFVFVSAVDLRSVNYRQSRFYGADDARFLNDVAEYDAERYIDDPMLAFALRNPHSGSISLRNAVAHAGWDYATEPYVRWVRENLGAGESVVRYSAPYDDLILGVSLHAHADMDTPDQADSPLFRMLFHHMECAMRLVARGTDLESDETARLLVDRGGRVRAVSKAAATLLSSNDGLMIRQGRLLGCDAAGHRRIDAAIQSALQALSHGSAGFAFRLSRPSGKRDWLLKACPLPAPPSPFEAFRPAALVRIVDPEAGPAADAADQWPLLFGFTPAETRLATELLNSDDSVRQAAERLGIAYATARVQLASMFDKTGVRSQSQLARLLTRLEA